MKLRQTRKTRLSLSIWLYAFDNCIIFLRLTNAFHLPLGANHQSAANIPSSHQTPQHMYDVSSVSMPMGEKSAL